MSISTYKEAKEALKRNIAVRDKFGLSNGEFILMMLIFQTENISNLLRDTDKDTILNKIKEVVSDLKPDRKKN